MKRVDISVVVPALNEEARIAACLKSLRQQSFSGSFEIIVADGNSEDKTREIARKLADKVVVEKRRSCALERNAGAKVAKGKIIAFVDSDSVVEKEWLQSIWNVFKNNESLAFAYGSVFYSDAKGFDAKVPEVLIPFYLGFFNAIGFDAPIGANIAVRRSVFEKLQGFNTRHVTCEDLDLAKRAKKLGKIAYDSRIIVKTSARRVKKWGYLNFMLFHLGNVLQFHLLGKSHKEYEAVR